MPNRPKRGSGERSNWYSGSKFTNWTPFDPYSSELRAATTQWRPAATIDFAGLSSPIPIFSRGPHRAFVHPCSVADVQAVLSSCPARYLDDLEAVFLLAGSSKQEKALKLFRYGCYSASQIYLHAYPRSIFVQRYESAPPPHIRRLYKRFGVELGESDGGWTLRFNEHSLRRFYLYDVLLHELGHHVDSRVDSRPNRDAERYAEWFAEEQARRLEEPSAG